MNGLRSMSVSCFHEVETLKQEDGILSVVFMSAEHSTVHDVQQHT